MIVKGKMEITCDIATQVSELLESEYFGWLVHGWIKSSCWVGRGQRNALDGTQVSSYAFPENTKLVFQFVTRYALLRALTKRCVHMGVNRFSPGCSFLVLVPPSTGDF